MAEDVKDLIARLKLDIEDFEKNAKKAEGATEELVKTTKEAATSNDKWGESFDRVMNAFTGINQGIQLVQQVLGGLKKAYDAVVTSTAEYAESIYHASNLAGVSTEQMSRLVQAADDFRVSQETLTGAMGMALKNGFVPTIENLAALSDELLAIKDPAERAARATEIFGRQWEGVMPLLLQGGDAIREATGSISDNLVVTDEAAKNAMDYAAQVDALSDAWTGLKMNAGQAVLPIVIKILTEMNQSNQLSGLREQYGKNLRSLMLLGQISKDEYNEAMKLAYDRTMPVADAVDYLSGKVEETGEQISFVAQKTDDWASANYDFGYSQESVTNAAEVSVQAIDDLTDAYEKQRDELEKGLIQANMKLNVEISTFREGIANQLVQGLRDAGLSGEKLTNVLGIIDGWAGTNHILKYEMELAVDDLIDLAVNHPEQLEAALGAFDDTFLPLQQSVIAAQDEVNILQGQLDAIEREYTATIRVFTITGTGGGTSASHYQYGNSTFNPNANAVYPNAGGGQIYPGQMIKWGEYGPETFISNTSGRILSRADSMNAVGQAYQSDGYDSELIQAIANIPTAKDIARAVRDAILLAGG